jgi:hypothetical protein
MDDIAALVAEIRISNERQERLLSLLKDAMKVKDRMIDDHLKIPLDNSSGQGLADCNSAAKHLSEHREATKKNLDVIAEILLLGSKFSLTDNFHRWKYWCDSATLQIPDGKKLIKLQWVPDEPYPEENKKKLREG